MIASTSPRRAVRVTVLTALSAAFVLLIFRPGLGEPRFDVEPSPTDPVISHEEDPRVSVPANRANRAIEEAREAYEQAVLAAKVTLVQELQAQQAKFTTANQLDKAVALGKLIEAINADIEALKNAGDAVTLSDEQKLEQRITAHLVKYQWQAGNAKVTFNEDGSATHSLGGDGTWKFSDLAEGVISVNFTNFRGRGELWRLSADGKSIRQPGRRGNTYVAKSK